MTKFTREQINDIINLKGNDGRQIDIFELYGVLFLGNSENRKWDLNKNFIKLSEHNIPIYMDDFEDCETEDDVCNAFSDELKGMTVDRLL